MVISEFSEPMWVVAASIFVISSSCDNEQLIISYPEAASILHKSKKARILPWSVTIAEIGKKKHGQFKQA